MEFEGIGYLTPSCLRGPNSEGPERLGPSK